MGVTNLITSGTEKWWQSRTIWVTVIAFLATQAKGIFPASPWPDIVQGLALALIPIFMRLGILKAQEEAAKAAEDLKTAM